MSIPNLPLSPTAVILCGIQGAGKSTFFYYFLSGGYARVNLDTLRTRGKEQRLLDELIAARRSLAVDNTNPTKADRLRYIPSLKAAGYRIIGCYFEPDKTFSLAHNAIREGRDRVPDIAIHATAAKLEPLEYGEGFDEIYSIINDGENFSIFPVT